MGRLWSLKEFNKNTNKQQELEKSFLKIFNHTFQFIGLLDLEGNLLAANATALNLVGVKEEDVLGKPFWETAWWNHSPQHQSQLKAGIKAAAQGQIVRFETSHFDKNNHQIEVDFSLKPIQDETGKIIGLIPEGRDITEIKKTQKQLDENKAELQAIFDVLPDLFFRMDGNGIILEYRASSEFELYVSPDIFLGKSMIDILPHTVAQKWQKAIDKVLKSRTLVSLEYSLSMAGGEEYYEARLVPFSQEQVVAIVRNISESRRSEIALKKSKTFLQTIIDYLPVALFVKDGKPEKFGQILLVNKTCEDIFGLVASEVITKNVHDLFPLEQAKFYEQKDREAFSKRELIEIPEETINIDNKGKIIAHTIKIPLYDEHQEPEYLICITEDITQRKKAELNLKKINVLLQGISSAQSQFINNTDPTILFNDLLENFLNLTESEYGFMGEILYTDQEQAYVEETYIKLRGKSSLKTQGLTDITWDEETRKFSAQNAPQDMEFHNLKSLFGAVITTGKAVIVNNPATDSKPGALPQGYAPLNTFLGLPFYQNNHLAGIMGLANRKNGYDQDLIDYLQPFLTTCANLIRAYRNESIRREAEKQREASENKLQALLKYSTDVVSIFDRQGRLMYHSPAGEQIYGFSMEEMQQQRTFNLIHPEDRTRVGKTFSKLLKEPEKIITVEYRYQTKQGNYIWMETVASNQLDNPEIKGIVANSREITQRKQVETALRDSETKFRQLAENIHEVFWIIDISMTDRTYYKSLYVSPAYEEVWGYTPEEMYKHPMQWLEAIHPEDRVLIEKDLSQKLIQGRFNHEYRIIRPDGTLRWIRDRGFPVQNHSGEFVRITGLAEDITQQKATEEEIKRLNEALRQQNYYLEQKVAQRTQELELLLNTLPDFVFVVERYTMKLLFCNQVFAEGSGFSDRNQVQGKTIFDCFSPEVADYFAQQNEQVFNSGETLHIEETLAFPDGDRYFDTYKVPLKNSQGQIYALLGTARDLTELVRTKKRLMERTTQLEAANQELDAFCYSVSHDLRAPLRHIHGFVNALKQQLTGSKVFEDTKVVHYLEVIQKSSEKMGYLIDGLLTLSRVGRREFVFNPVNLNAVVKAAINLVTFEDDQIEFNIGELPTVKGDTALLKQVFVNLLENSLKFSRGRNPISITIDVLEDNAIFVSDNGVGFDMEYADKLFGAFQRLHSQKEFEGTGIGLSIVQRIIHRHGGKIWAESTPGNGATFYIGFPN